MLDVFKVNKGLREIKLPSGNASFFRHNSAQDSSNSSDV